MKLWKKLVQTKVVVVLYAWEEWNWIKIITKTYLTSHLRKNSYRLRFELNRSYSHLLLDDTISYTGSSLASSSLVTSHNWQQFHFFGDTHSHN